MSEFILDDPSKSGFVKGRVNDVTFLYVTIQNAREKFTKNGSEYSVKLVVDKKTAKAFEKQYSKQGFTDCETENFEELYGVAPPFPGEDTQYIITIKAPDDSIIRSKSSDGEEIETSIKLDYDEFKRPKVYVPSNSGVKDVTMDFEIANGSKGHASFWELSTTTYGNFARLSGILVNDLKIYENRSNDQCAFGKVENANTRQPSHFESQEREDPPILDDELPF